LQVERLNVNAPTTFPGLHTLGSVLANAADPANQIAAAACAFAAKSIAAELLSQPDYGIPPPWGYVEYLPSDDVSGMRIVMAAVAAPTN
jgi:hypothetical protein